MKRPSFQFYPGDWQANSNLRRCTHEEKGIWIDVMCLLHDQEEYGISRWPLKELAQAVGCSVAKLKGLVTKGVFKGADVGNQCDPLIYIPRSGRKNGPEVTLIEKQDGPVWYSSRMVIDEYKRVLRGELGAAPKATPDHSLKDGLGATPKGAPDRSPKGGFGAAPKGTPDPSPSRVHASSSSSSSVNPEVIHTESESERPPHEMPPDSVPVKPKTPAGEACLAIRQAGIPTVNPSHPTLIALLEAGADASEFGFAAREAVAKGKADFAYVIGTVRKRREEAAALVLHHGRMPNKQEALEASNRSSTAGWVPPELREKRT